jgi:predicted acetyltransferase
LFLADSQNSATARVDDLVKLEKIAVQENWEIVNVASDGNCMFSAISIQLNRSDSSEDAWLVRQELVEYLEKNSSIVSELFCHLVVIVWPELKIT